MTQRCPVWFVMVLVAAVGAGCRTPAPRPAAATVAVKRDKSDVFAARRFAATSTAYSVSATSLAGGVDLQVVERMVRQRLGEATELALRDLLAGAAAQPGVPRPAVDLLEALRALVVQLSDAETRSQSLVAALLRDGLSYLAVELVGTGDLPSLGCPAEALADAAYEGLAASSTLRPLGFAAASGSVAEGCGRFTAQVAATVDTLAVVGLDARPVTVAFERARAAAAACGDPGVAPLLSVDLRIALSHAGKAGDPAGAELSSLRELRAAFARSRQPLTVANPPDLARFDACFEALDRFALQVERELDPRWGDWSMVTGLSAAQLVASVEQLRRSAAGAPSDPLIAFHALVAQVSSGRPLRRGDVVTLSGALERNTATLWRGRVVRTLLAAVFEAVPQAVREDAASPSGVRLDVPALSTTMTSRFAESRRGGLYVRASVGAGYLGILSGKDDGVAASVHEELGVGYRFGDARFLFGPHAIVSGLLYQVVSEPASEDAFFAGIGGSVSLYRLIDVSASVGRLYRDELGDRWATLISLQLPLSDYLRALTEGGPTTESGSPGK